MTRFVVRPTGPSESDGYSVVDTNREDEKCSAQIGRMLQRRDAAALANMLNMLAASTLGEDATRACIRAVLAACADAHDDYLSDEEKRANREAHEKSAEQASKMPAALRRILGFVHDQSLAPGKRLVAIRDTAREALGE